MDFLKMKNKIKDTTPTFATKYVCYHPDYIIKIYVIPFPLWDVQTLIRYENFKWGPKRRRVLKVSRETIQGQVVQRISRMKTEKIFFWIQSQLKCSLIKMHKSASYIHTMWKPNTTDFQLSCHLYLLGTISMPPISFFH